MKIYQITGQQLHQILALNKRIGEYEGRMSAASDLDVRAGGHYSNYNDKLAANTRDDAQYIRNLAKEFARQKELDAAVTEEKAIYQAVMQTETEQEDE